MRESAREHAQRVYWRPASPGKPGGKGQEMAGLIILGVVLVLALIVLFSSFFTVEQQTAALVERFGKFQRVARSGLNFKVPIIDRVAGRINLRGQQLDVNVG